MAKIVILYLYRLQKEIKAALEKGNIKAASSSSPNADPEIDDYCFYSGEHLCSDQIKDIIKNKG